MKTEIIAVGTEILLGQITNTNATFLSQELAALGFEVYYHTVVGDNPVRLEEALKLADQRSELIVLCGGLGPTDDDLTKDVVADHVGAKLVVDETGLAKIKQQILRSHKVMTDNNVRQATAVEGGVVLQNPNGLALGALIPHHKHHYLLFPGPPAELKPMFFEEARPLLQKLLPEKEVLTSRVLRFIGIGESTLVTLLDDLIKEQTNPTLAPYAKASEVTLRLTAKSGNQEDAKKLLDELEEKIQKICGEYFYGYGDDNSLQQVVVSLLQKKGKTITAAESLTAGMFQSMLGDVPGASEVFPGGVVTYSPKVKESLTGVPCDVIKEHGTVSEACAKEMAAGILAKMDTDFALSFTGVAGPDDLEGHAPGTVFIGLAEKGQPVVAEKFLFNRDRHYVRYSAVMAGLNWLRKRLDEKK